MSTRDSREPRTLEWCNHTSSSLVRHLEINAPRRKGMTHRLATVCFLHYNIFEVENELQTRVERTKFAPYHSKLQLRLHGPLSAKIPARLHRSTSAPRGFIDPASARRDIGAHLPRANSIVIPSILKGNARRAACSFAICVRNYWVGRSVGLAGTACGFCGCGPCGCGGGCFPRPAIVRLYGIKKVSITSKWWHLRRWGSKGVCWSFQEERILMEALTELQR